MRKTGLVALFLVILTGCGVAAEDDLQPIMDFRAQMLTNGCSFTAQVTADYGDRVYEFSMDCQCKDDETTIAITQPQSIAGITATVKNDTGIVSFDGTQLDFGTMAEGNIVPLAVPAVVADSWQNAFIASAGKERDKYRASFERGYGEEKVVVDTWFSLENHLPVYAQVCYNGTCILQMKITDFEKGS